MYCTSKHVRFELAEVSSMLSEALAGIRTTEVFDEAVVMQMWQKYLPD